MVTQISGEVAPDALGLSELAYVAFVLHDIGPERIAAAPPSESVDLKG